MTNPSHEMADAIEARIELADALDAIAAGSHDAVALESAIAGFKGSTHQDAQVGIAGAFVDTLDALAHAVHWVHEAREAHISAERHLAASRLRAGDLLAQAGDGWPDGLQAAASELAECADFMAPSRAASQLRCVPLPPRLTEFFRDRNQQRFSFDEEPARGESPAVGLLVQLHGEPVMKPALLQPRALNHLEIEARVQDWPDEAEELEVGFLGVHDELFLSASKVRFTPDAMIQPLEIHIAGDRPAGDPPLELTARADFLSDEERIPARVVGNATLQVVTFDPDTATPLNLPTAARRVLEMTGEVNNALPNLSAADRRDVRLLLEGVLRFAHTVLDDRLDRDQDVDEAWFQQQLMAFLQADPFIGARLDEKAHRAGGETDPVLGNVVLELKVEKDDGITLDEACERFVGQPTQYASAGDGQVSLLAILDVSPKRAPAGVIGNEVGWARPQLSSGPTPRFPSMVGVVVIRGAYPRPSDFSR